jgi:hypothetical protein
VSGMDNTNHNQAMEEALETISQLGPIRELADELRHFPVSLLRQVCEEYTARQSPVPDHILKMPPYLGETALRALMEGGLVERTEDQRFAIHAYAPTDEGRAMIERIDQTSQAKRPRRKRE